MEHGCLLSLKQLSPSVPFVLQSMESHLGPPLPYPTLPLSSLPQPSPQACSGSHPKVHTGTNQSLANSKSPVEINEPKPTVTGKLSSLSTNSLAPKSSITMNYSYSLLNFNNRDMFLLSSFYPELIFQFIPESREQRLTEVTNTSSRI